MRTNLDDLRRQREEALAAGVGSGRWIRCATALMDAFPGHYETAKAMNAVHLAMCGAQQRMEAVVHAARLWAFGRQVNDAGEAGLLKALWTLGGDREEGCFICDGHCGEDGRPCAPRTVAEAHALIDQRLHDLHRKRKVHFLPQPPRPQPSAANDPLEKRS